jgi:hypothetical protein
MTGSVHPGTTLVSVKQPIVDAWGFKGTADTITACLAYQANATRVQPQSFRGTL